MKPENRFHFFDTDIIIVKHTHRYTSGYQIKIKIWDTFWYVFITINLHMTAILILDVLSSKVGEKFSAFSIR